MKIRVRDGRMSVRRHPGDHRPVVIAAAGLEFALTPSEALTLADRLVDAVENSRDHHPTHLQESP